MKSIATRIFSLIAAYSLALHALFFSMTLPAHVSTHVLGDVGASQVLLCSNAPDGGQPSGQPPCAPDCFMLGCGMGGFAPPAAAVLVIVAPAETSITLAYAFAPRARPSIKTPQEPRAPPLA
jgi:hypothetical protein